MSTSKILPKKISEIAQILGGQFSGNEDLAIQGVTNVDHPGPGLITFIQDKKDLLALEKSDIACIIAPPTLSQSSKPLILVKNPKLAWAKLLSLYHPCRQFPSGVSPLAQVASTAKLGKDVTIEPFSVIGDNTEIGDHTVIRSFAYIDQNVKIGANCLLHASVVIYDQTVIGSKVVLHAGTIIGSDGFGYVHTETGQEKVPQVGNVVIEDDVEIGACATIDRATIGSTRIGKGCKIDNAVQIGHNVVIKEHTVISSQTGISGSCKVGAHVTMGGKVGLGDHVEIGDWTMIGAGAGFPTGKRVPEKQIVFGQPARPYTEARRQIAAQLRSAEMLEDIKKLKHQLAQLQSQIEKK